MVVRHVVINCWHVYLRCIISCACVCVCVRVSTGGVFSLWRSTDSQAPLGQIRSCVSLSASILESDSPAPAHSFSAVGTLAFPLLSVCLSVSLSL